jgi:hypothetical protein
MNRKRVIFCLQPTPSFPAGAPQREEYVSDGEYLKACKGYRAEWLGLFECAGCKRNQDGSVFPCPQHRTKGCE